jgi:hypothetical protein
LVLDRSLEKRGGENLRVLNSQRDDQNRPAKYSMDQYGMVHQARTNYTFGGGGQATSYLDTLYTLDNNGSGKTRRSSGR